jgi:DNA-nicking Smr family endonuclease
MSRKPPDFDLWTQVAKTVTPLQRRRAARAAAHATPPIPARPVPHVSAPHVHVPRPPAPHVPPPLAAFDRRTAQKMLRGTVESERRIDLHGVGVELARLHLLSFLRGAHADQVRTVLVITGKGASPFARHTLHGAAHFHAPEREGRLRRLVPEWLSEAEFRALVSGFQPAHPRHGGGGAYYVKIRRIR